MYHHCPLRVHSLSHSNSQECQFEVSPKARPDRKPWLADYQINYLVRKLGNMWDLEKWDKGGGKANKDNIVELVTIIGNRYLNLAWDIIEPYRTVLRNTPLKDNLSFSLLLLSSCPPPPPPAGRARKWKSVNAFSSRNRSKTERWVDGIQRGICCSK